MSGIHAFDDELGPDLSAEVAAILMAPAELTEDQALALYNVLAPRFLDGAVNYDADFDLRGEVEAQIRAVRAMRDSVILPGGAIRPGVASRELKEVVTASNTLLQTLMKTHEKVLNYDRQRSLEAATVAAVQSLSPSQRETFFETREAELENIK
jgi:hypothetical protein